MRLCDVAAGTVIHAGLEILHELAVPPDIHGLGAVADSQDGLAKIEGVLEEKFVHRGSGGVGLAAFWNPLFSITLWVHVESAAGEQNALHSGEQLGNAPLWLVERNDDRLGASGLQRLAIWR